MSQPILIIEDDVAMRGFLSSTLVQQQLPVVEAASAMIGERLAVEEQPAVILLDLGLPDDDGLTLLKRLRAWTTTPVIVISGRASEADKIAALDAGADDYVMKPFAAGELLARIRAALRRSNSQTLVDERVITVGPFVIDHARHEAQVDGRKLQLTPI